MLSQKDKLRPRDRKWILIIILIPLIIVCVMFIPPKDFRIKSGTLVTYEGGAKEVIIPRTVKTISSKAFDSTVVDIIIVGGNVKKVEEGAFAYSKISKFIFKEGVEKIDENALRNTDPKEILFPKSLKTGVSLDNLLTNEEVFVYLVKDSYIDKYYKDNPPKENIKIKYSYNERVKKYD